MEEKKGYQFVGWYIDEERTKRLNPGGILPHEMTLYDKWVPILYPINYIMNGGVNSRKNPKFTSIESGVLLLHPAKKNGEIFDGWYLNGKKVTYIPEEQLDVVTLEARFKPLITVHFETFEGANIADKQTNEYRLLDSLLTPTRLGFQFDGWFWDADYRYPFYIDQPIQEECTLYAKWNLAQYKIQYNTNGGVSSRLNPKSYTYFDETIILKPAKKKGYEFMGWFDARNNPLNEIRQGSLGDKLFIAHYRKMD